MQAYIRKVYYYETDRMGITHHSNYIRWMEEARLDFLNQIGCNYDEMEMKGVISPVVSVNCRYKRKTTYSDVISINVRIKEFDGITLKFGYRMVNTKDDMVVCIAESEHCFVDSDFKLMNLKKDSPDYYQKIQSAAVGNN